MEWASFPVLADTKGATRSIKAGQSYYAGDGLNKALVSPAAVRQELAKARAAVVAPPSAPLPPQTPAVPIPDVPLPASTKGRPPIGLIITFILIGLAAAGLFFVRF